FVSGEYSGILGTGSPLSGRAAWTGLSAGTPAAPAYINTVVNLPATANGHSIRLRFRVVADSNTVAPGVPGVRIDTITLTTGSQCGAATPTPTPTPTPTATPTPTPSPSPTPSCGTTNLFQDPGFEASTGPSTGPLTNPFWASTSTQFGSSI